MGSFVAPFIAFPDSHVAKFSYHSFTCFLGASRFCDVCLNVIMSNFLDSSTIDSSMAFLLSAGVLNWEVL